MGANQADSDVYAGLTPYPGSLTHDARVVALKCLAAAVPAEHELIPLS